MIRGRRIFLVACAASLLAHLALLGNAGLWWTPPAEEIPFPLAARLQADPAVKAAVEERSAPPPSPQLMTPATPSAEIPPPPPSPTPLAPTIAPPPIPEPVSVPPPHQVIPPPLLQPSVQAPPAPAKTPLLRPARSLPPRVTLSYSVATGDEGLSVGRAVYSWTQSEERYRLESVAEATGLFSLFISGRIRQVSEGKISAEGLHPELFSQSRGERRPDTARFDWAAGRIDMNGVEAPLPALAQDLLSFSFHLALTLKEDIPEWRMAVSNGRRLNDYAFLVLGHESLTLGSGAIDVVHVRGARSGEGALDVWLAPARSWLPVRLRTLDTKGKVITLTLEEQG